MGHQPGMHAGRTAHEADSRQQQEWGGGQQGQEDPQDAQDQGHQPQEREEGADHHAGDSSNPGRNRGSGEEGSRQVRIRDLLAQLPLFNELPLQDLEPIVRGTTEVSAVRGDIIFRRGEPCVGFHVVIYGQVKLVFISNSGVERVVRLIGPGDGFGEALMFMGQNYIVTAEALRDTMLLHVGRDALFGQIDRNPGMARKMLAGLSRRLYSLMGDVEAYTLHTGAQRLIGYLLKGQAGHEGGPIRLEASKALIASRLNLTPEHFSRILRELSDKGLIRVRGREVTILDQQALSQYQG